MHMFHNSSVLNQLSFKDAKVFFLKPEKVGIVANMKPGRSEAYMLHVQHSVLKIPFQIDTVWISDAPVQERVLF